MNEGYIQMLKKKMYKLQLTPGLIVQIPHDPPPPQVTLNIEEYSEEQVHIIHPHLYHQSH